MGIDLAKHVFRPGEGEALAMQGPTSGTVTILVDPENTGETQFCTLIQTLDPGAEVPIHRHEKAEQVLFFFGGRGKAVVEGHDVDLVPGTTLHVPRETWHGFRNTGDEPLCMIETTSPPGFEQAFRELCKLSASVPEAVTEILAKHDIVTENSES